jgi:hypothetical protein
MNEKRVADYNFAIATLKKRLQEKQTVLGKKISANQFYS